MGWNGAGTFTRTYNWSDDAANGIKISASRHDTNDTDFVNGINNCITKDGQNAATANLPMGGNVHTNVGNASALTNYASASDVITNALTYYTASGTDTYTITPSPSISAYAAGQIFQVNFTNANTGAATLNVNSVGAVAIVDKAGNALTAGDIAAGAILDCKYDGTNFQVTGLGSFNPNISSPSNNDLLAYNTSSTSWENVPFAGVGVQTGTIDMYGGATAPSGYLICDGSAVSRTTYAALYAVIGDAFGYGDNSTTFNVPDMRGRFPRGVDGATGNDPDAAGRTAMNTGGNTGDNVGSVQADATAQANSAFTTASAGSHSHTIATSGGSSFVNGSISGNGSLSPIGTGNTASAGSHTHSISGGDNETRPLNAYVTFIIKT